MPKKPIMISTCSQTDAVDTDAERLVPNGGKITYDSAVQTQFSNR
jgi:hypothetical protein